MDAWKARQMAMVVDDDVLKKELHAEAWYSPHNDNINIKVRIAYTTKTGRLIKKGLIFKCTEELLQWTAEGCEYVHAPLPDRFELIGMDDE